LARDRATFCKKVGDELVSEGMVTRNPNKG
jgi:hypothetical protein